MLDLRRQPNSRNRNWIRKALLSSLVGGLLASPTVAVAQQTQFPAQTPSVQLQSPAAQYPATGYPASQIPALPQQTMPTLTTPQTTAKARLQVYNVPSHLIGVVGAQLELQYHNNPGVRVTTEPKTGQLMIMAPDTVHQTISQQISALMQQNGIQPAERGRAVAAVNQQSYTLRNLSWRELEDALAKLGGTRVSMTTERNGEIANLSIANTSGLQDILQIDRRTNLVTMLGSGPEINGWAQVVYSLDQGQGDHLKATHVVPLSPAQPRKVRQAFQLVAATIQQEAAAQTEATVGVGGDESVTAMGSIEDIGSGSGLFGDVQIEFLEEIDLVIIRGSKEDVQRTLAVIEKIKDQADETQPEIEVYTLKHANGQAVEVLVNELYETIYLPRQGAASITALVQPNALLIIGRKEVVATVISLVEKIDQPLDDEHQLKVRRLSHASSVDVEDRIRQFFVANPGSDDAAREGLGSKAMVVADYRTNSLIIQASPREMIEIEKMITELDVEGTTAKSDVRVFKLKNTLADDLQVVIQEVITGQGEGGDTSLAQPPSGVLSIVGTSGERLAESGILAGIIVTSDPSVNALVVKAPAQSMHLIETLINELDQLPSAEARIKVFEVENGDATSLASLLQQLFGLEVTAGQSTTGGLFGLGNQFQQAAITTGGEGTLVPLRISVDTRTNSVIVSGSASDLEVIEVLLMRLDEEGVETRRTEVVWLRNAEAIDVATAMTSFLDLQRQAVQQTLLQGGYISIFEQVDREVFVVAEPQTNMLILSATPRYYDTMMDVINRLDRRPPLINIEVLIAEVQLDDGFEFGTEWGIQDGLLFDRQSATGGSLSSPVFDLGNPLSGPSGGAGQTQNVAGQAISNFALGRANSDLIGGLVLSASSEAVGVLIRALQTAGRLQVLSTPRITTLESQEASTVLVGQLVPRVTSITAGGNGVGQTIGTEDAEVGLGLAVVPRVNQDGLIVMNIQVFNSSLADTETGIPVGFGPNGEVIRSPIINTTEATTWISAYSGQTVVFAGLISKQRQSTSRRIPILGSLPVIGPAFRFDSESEQRRELLVVMTPRIIQTDEDYEMLKQVESSRMSWCLADVQNVFGDAGMSGGNGLWGPAKSPVIFPDLQPAVIDGESTPPVDNTFAPSIIDSYPLGSDTSIPQINPPVIDNSASSSTTGRFRAVGFQSPAGGVNPKTSVRATGTYR